MRNIYIILIVAACSGVSWYLGSQHATRQAAKSPGLDRKSGAAGDSAEASGRRDDRPLPSTVHGLGKLQPQSGVLKIFAPPGQRIDSLFGLTTGSKVTVGQDLVALAAKATTMAQLDLAIARKTDAENKLQFEKQQGDYKVQAAKLAVAEAAAGAEEIESKSKSIELLRQQKKIAVDALDRLRRLAGNEVTRRLINRSDVEKQRLQVQQLETQLQQADNEIQLAKAKVERAQQAAQLNYQTAQFAIESADQVVPTETLDKAIRAAETAVDLTTIKSPIDATVLDIVATVGDSATNRPVMLIGDLSMMICVAEINDSQMQFVKKDSKVTLSSPAMAQPITGVVDSVGIMIGPPSIQDPNPFASVDRSTGKVIIVLDDPAAARRFVNLQVDVEIEVE